MRTGAPELLKNLKEGYQYLFLGVLENKKQDLYKVIWSSSLSDYIRVLADNQFAVPVLTYFMWTQVWLITELQRIDHKTRNIMVKN